MTRFLFLVAALTAGLLPALGASVTGAELPRTDRSSDPLPKGAIARLGTPPLAAHTGAVYSVAYFSDGRYLVTCDPLRMLVWDATGKLLRRYPDDLPAGEKVLLNTAKHGRFLTAELPAGVLRLRDLVTGKELRRLEGKDGYVSSGRWDVSEVSADATLAAIVGPGGVRIYDLQTGGVRCQFKPKHPVCGLRFSADKRTLAVMCVVTLQANVKVKVPLTSYRDTRSGDKAEAPVSRTPWKDDVGRWSEGLPDIRARLRKLKLYVGQLPAGAEIPDVIGNAYESPDGRYLAIQGQTGPLSSRDSSVPFAKDESYVRIWDIVTHRLIVELDAKHYTHQIVGFTPDSRTLLSYTAFPTTIHLWECATGRERLRLAGHKNGDVRLAFRPDGRALVSGGTDTQVFLWDVTGRAPDGVWRETRHSPQRLAELWQELADGDAARAYRATWSLTASPAQTSTLLGEKLRPAVAPDPRRLARLLSELDNDDFTEREKATHVLEELGELAEPALRRVLKERPTLERRRRCEELLDKLTVASGERLRAIRAVEVLERLGSAEARALLEKVCQGEPPARLTHEARAALKRLAAVP